MLPKAGVFSVGMLALVGGLVIALSAGLHPGSSDRGLFNNYFRHSSAILAHERAWERTFGKVIPVSRLIAVVRRYEGACTPGVRSYTLHNVSRQSKAGVLFCTVNRSGGFPMFFVSHKWDCAFETQLRQRLRLIGCQRQSASF